MAKKGMNIYHRKDGRWEGRYKTGYTDSGKIKYSSVYGKSYSNVKEQLEKKRAETYSGAGRNTGITVGKLIEVWLADIKYKLKASTLANYSMKLQKHILPYFADIKYEKLTAEKLNAFISLKITENLSAKYISDIVVLLKSAAKFAQKRYGCVNRIECVSLPKSKCGTVQKLLSDSEQSKLKAALTKEPTCSNIGILLSLSTGIRIGELCALKWQDIDLEKSILTVRKTVQRIYNSGDKSTSLVISEPKSESSVREIPLPDFIVPFLNSIRASDNCFLLSGSADIVEPRTMQYRFKSLLGKTDLPYVNFHALRHMFATNCIALGFDVKTLSEILGHSSVEITLNRYVHSSMERKKSCMKLFPKKIPAA